MTVNYQIKFATKEDQKKALPLPLTNWVNGELDKIKGYDQKAFQDIVDPLLIVAFAILRDLVEMPLEDAVGYAASVMKWTYIGEAAA